MIEPERQARALARRVDRGSALGVRDVSECRSLSERLQERGVDLDVARVELAESREALANSLQAQAAVFDALPAHVAVLDADGTIQLVNEAWRRFAAANGADPRKAGVGVNYLDVCDASANRGAREAARVAMGMRGVLAGTTDTFTLEYPCPGPGGDAWFRLAVSRWLHGHGGVAGAIAMHVDISERVRAEAALEQLAYFDTLTGLRSRAGLAAGLSERLADGPWPSTAVMVTLDLVNFRGVNDAYGFDVGDGLLVAVGRRLVDVLGDGAWVARVGGDGFAVCAEPTTQRSPGAVDGASDVLDRVVGAFDRPFVVDDYRLVVAIRVGFTELGATVRPVNDLLREAELALYEGPRGESGGLSRRFTTELDVRVRERVRTSRELKAALVAGEFVLHYQPKVDMTSGQLVAGEALVRWQHPERGLLAPGAFIEAAERSGLIVPLGRWVLDEACRVLRRWQDSGLDIVRIAVNVSVEQLQQSDFADEVAAALARHGVAPSGLTVEITESVFGGASERLGDQLRALNALGVRLALDDFGTGFSSLQYLKDYRFDELKVDRSFVRDMLRDAQSLSLVRTIVGIAQAVGAEVIAEGVETAAQREALVALSCRVGQGYYFSVPLAEEDFRWLLEKRAPLPLEVHAP